MKVTDEMVELAAGVIYERLGLSPPDDELAGEIAFAALSAALKDEPEQLVVAADLTDALMRANSAEDRLARIAQWAEEAEILRRDRVKLEAILRGEQP